LGYPQPIETYIDEDLLQYTEVWAAAGAPRAVFQCDPSDLLQLTGGKVVAVKQS
jgi:prolyl-tRNA editing enzyme YbaK/EbsC (Cys-tRNA(Pro) deacylase)